VSCAVLEKVRLAADGAAIARNQEVEEIRIVGKRHRSQITMAVPTTLLAPSFLRFVVLNCHESERAGFAYQ
jgi:hypothetical protein